MLIGGIALGIVLGLVLGGRIERLADVRLRYLPLLLLAVVVRFGTEILLGVGGFGLVDALRLPLLAGAYGLLLVVLWRNRGYPGLALAFVGVACNAIVITWNGGYMPVWTPALEASGLPSTLGSSLHVMLAAGTTGEFFLRLGPLADTIPIPWWPIQNVASVGDLFLSSGLAIFLIASLLRAPEAIQQALIDARIARIATTRLPRPAMVSGVDGGAATAETGLSPAFAAAAALDRPQMLGGGGIGLASPSSSVLSPELIPELALDPAPGLARELSPGHAPELAARTAPVAAARLAPAVGVAAIPVPAARPGLLERVRSHPYVHLSLNGTFSALWVGQVISLFGDRVNQIALGAFVFEVTDSPLAVALTFLVGTVPNLLFSPLAGTFVDRWDQKQVLVVSDILRAALVLLVPVAVLINVWLAYPLVFAMTTVSIFFRPARSAILPRIVADDDLLAANSAMWVGETLADVVNYPLAGLFVVFLAGSLSLAFWFDAATYLASAALLATMIVPPVIRRARGGSDAAGAAGGVAADEAEEAEDAIPTPTTVMEDLRAGWAFLRHETVLLANTLQGTAGQFAIGFMTVAAIFLARAITPGTGDEYRGTWAFMEAAIGVGNLIGGFALGLVAGRTRKGPLVAVAYAAFGVLLVLVGITQALPMMLALLFGVGVANMAFVIPSQTLFQERTPPELIGRVVSFRFALVFGGMSVAMGMGGLLIEVMGPGMVVAIGGVMSIAAGLAGLMVRAVREA